MSFFSLPSLLKDDLVPCSGYTPSLQEVYLYKIECVMNLRLYLLFPFFFMRCQYAQWSFFVLKPKPSLDQNPVHLVEYIITTPSIYVVIQ